MAILLPWVHMYLRVLSGGCSIQSIQVCCLIRKSWPRSSPCFIILIEFSFPEFLMEFVPHSTSHMLVQCVAGTMSGCTVALLTNPLDVLRANIQVSSRIGIIKVSLFLAHRKKYTFYFLIYFCNLIENLFRSLWLQVQRIESYSLAIQRLWSEEGYNVFKKGLSARITQSCISSAFIVAGYETLKRWSLYEEYKDTVRW